MLRNDTDDLAVNGANNKFKSLNLATGVILAPQPLVLALPQRPPGRTIATEKQILSPFLFNASANEMVEYNSYSTRERERE